MYNLINILLGYFLKKKIPSEIFDIQWYVNNTCKPSLVYASARIWKYQFSVIILHTEY